MLALMIEIWRIGNIVIEGYYECRNRNNDMIRDISRALPVPRANVRIPSIG